MGVGNPHGRLEITVATMRRYGPSVLLVTVFVPLLSVGEQRVFSVDYPKIQKITPQHHQPWSLVLSQDVDTSDCIIHKAPEHAQFHRSIKDPGDVVVINKTQSSLDNVEDVKEYIVEIIGFDNRVLCSPLLDE